MVIKKGIEIIPKRDKVTYATNITGKWENYSIETYQGKAVKKAAERLKILIQENNTTAIDGEVTSLKSILLNSGVEQPEVKIDFTQHKVVDLFDVPIPSKQEIETVKTTLDKIEEIKKSMPCKEVQETLEEIKTTVFEEVAKKAAVPVTTFIEDPKPKITLIDNTGTDEGTFVIHAMKNKAGEQMYLSSWDDAPTDWCISLIPYVTSKKHCHELIDKANKMLSNCSRASIKKLQQDITFEIVKVNSDGKKEDTYQDIVARANKLLEEARAKRNA